MANSINTPLDIENLLIKLKLLPLDYKIQIDNKEGSFYIQDIIVDAKECTAILTLTKIPQ